MFVSMKYIIEIQTYIIVYQMVQQMVRTIMKEKKTFLLPF